MKRLLEGLPCSPLHPVCCSTPVQVLALAKDQPYGACTVYSMETPIYWMSNRSMREWKDNPAPFESWKMFAYLLDFELRSLDTFVGNTYRAVNFRVSPAIYKQVLRLASGLRCQGRLRCHAYKNKRPMRDVGLQSCCDRFMLRSCCWQSYRTSPHRTAPHRTAPHRTAPHRTAPHRTAPHRTAHRVGHISVVVRQNQSVFFRSTQQSFHSAQETTADLLQAMQS